MTVEHVDEANELHLRQIVRCAATEMQLLQSASPAEVLRNQAYLPLYVIEIAVDVRGVVTHAGLVVAGQTS